MFVVVDTGNPKRYIGNVSCAPKLSSFKNPLLASGKQCFLVSWTSKAMQDMAAVNKSNVTTVSPRKMLKGQVLLMITKRFWTVRYAVGGERGLTEKTRAWGDIYAECCTDIKRKSGYENKNVCKISQTFKVLPSTHLRSLIHQGHFNGSCQDSHTAEYTAPSWRN